MFPPVRIGSTPTPLLANSGKASTCHSEVYSNYGRGICLFQRQRKHGLLTHYCSMQDFFQRHNFCPDGKPPVPEIIDPVFAKTSQNARFLLSENERFGLVFVKTGSINSGTEFMRVIFFDLQYNFRSNTVSFEDSYPMFA